MAPLTTELFSPTSAFKLRVKALPAPQRNKATDFGAKCKYDPVGYKELGVDVRVSSRESGSSGQTHTFSGIKVGQVSEVRTFRVPASNHALVLTVSNAEWDHSCYYYKSGGAEGYGVDSYCPYSAIWPKDCYQIELQFVTDHTQDF